jgi:hypothetical protein
LLCGTNGRVASGINDVNLGFDNCRSMFRKLPDAQSKTLVVDHKVLSRDQTVRLHGIEQRDVPGGIALGKRQFAQAINPAWFLRAHGERRQASHLLQVILSISAECPLSGTSM